MLMSSILVNMLDLSSLGPQIATRRKKLRLTQSELARRASVARSTLNALENGHIGELGFSKITRILSALGMELKFKETGSLRPTLDELMEKQRDDEGLDRRN